MNDLDIITKVVNNYLNLLPAIIYTITSITNRTNTNSGKFSDAATNINTNVSKE